MKKIMFNDKYGLTKAVLEGRKTMTRRIIPPIVIDWNRRGKVTLPVSCFKCGTLFMDASATLGRDFEYPAPAKYQPRFNAGEVVAVAQRYCDSGWNPDELQQTYVKKPTVFPDLDSITPHIGLIDLPFKYHKGWSNKMYVLAGLMPHQIRITNVWVERLQDISEEDCSKEGIYWDYGDYPYMATKMYKYDENDEYIHPKAAFAGLIDKVSGKGTWDNNPWVFVYEFELVK